jgi:hypothetical protein
MRMRTSILEPRPGSEDLLTLRRAIAQLAERCHVDLTERTALRRILDGDFSCCQATELEDCRQLAAMLTLLFRLEACSSEDIGMAGLRRLWRQHGRVLARFRLRRPVTDGRQPEVAF